MGGLSPLATPLRCYYRRCSLAYGLLTGSDRSHPYPMWLLMSCNASRSLTNNRMWLEDDLRSGVHRSRCVNRDRQPLQVDRQWLTIWWITIFLIYTTTNRKIIRRYVAVKIRTVGLGVLDVDVNAFAGKPWRSEMYVENTTCG